MKKVIAYVSALMVVACPLSAMFVSAEAEDTAQIQVVAPVSAQAGEDITVSLDVSNNPGIAGIVLNVKYNPEILELTLVENQSLFDGMAFDQSTDSDGNPDLSRIPYRLMWSPNAIKNYVDNGELAVLHFHVLDSATEGNTEIEIYTDADSTINMDYTEIYFETVNGNIDIINLTEEPTETESESETETETEEPTETESESETETETEEPTETESESETETETEEPTETESESETGIESGTETETIDGFSENKLCEMIRADFRKKNGAFYQFGDIVTNEDGTISFEVMSSSGQSLGNYVIDPKTGIGTDNKGEEVSLPQTGNNSLGTVATAVTALMLSLTGAFAVLKSGIFSRKKEDE